MGEPNKHYFVKTDPAFQQVYGWANAVIQAGNFTLTGHGQCQSDYIAGNNGNGNTLAANPAICTWANPYHFARTAHRTMRLYMLKLFVLDQVVDPEGSEPSHTRNTNLYGVAPVNPNFARPANFGNHLAANPNEAQWLVAHYDMLFPHFYIQNKIANIQPQQHRGINRQLIIVDYVNFVIWDIVTTLSIRCHRVPPGDYEFRAKPMVIYNRYDLVRGRVGRDVFRNYPFPRPADNDRDDPINLLPNAFGRMQLA